LSFLPEFRLASSTLATSERLILLSLPLDSSRPSRKNGCRDTKRRWCVVVVVVAAVMVVVVVVVVVVLEVVVVVVVLDDEKKAITLTLWLVCRCGGSSD
jgi:hypothetical protein